MTQVNDNLILICGESTTGKSQSLMNIKNPKGVVYLNCEAGKKLPFKDKFHSKIIITDPFQVEQALDEVEDMPDVHTLVVDSLSYLLEMYVSQYVLTAQDTRGAWGEFAQFFKRLMQQKVARSSKNVIFTAHTITELNEAEMKMVTKVPVQGSLKNSGIESYFSTVIATKKMPLNKLADYENDLLNYNEEEELLEYKYVFQTKLTKETVNERIRSSQGMWSRKETYINNDIQLVLDRLHEYYADDEDGEDEAA
jgi:hypothetical protein